MKKLVWILLLVNIVFFAVMQWGGGLLSADHSVQTQPPLHAEKILILNANAPLAAKTEAVSAVIAATSVAATASSVAKTEPAICMEWGDFSGADLSTANTALQNLKLGNKISQRQVEHTIGYWVFLPPLKDKAAVAQKLAQLKARGVEEYFVVQDDPQWLNAVSLGIFKTREAAQKFLETLQTKDVHSAQIGERSSKQKATVFTLVGLDNATVTKLNALQTRFPTTEIKSVSCY